MAGVTVATQERVTLGLPFRRCFRYLLLALRRVDQPTDLMPPGNLIDHITLTAVAADGVTRVVLEDDARKFWLASRYLKGFFDNNALALPLGIDQHTSSTKCRDIYRLELKVDLVPQQAPALLLELLVAAVGTTTIVPMGLTLHARESAIELPFGAPLP